MTEGGSITGGRVRRSGSLPSAFRLGDIHDIRRGYEKRLKVRFSLRKRAFSRVSDSHLTILETVVES